MNVKLMIAAALVAVTTFGLQAQYRATTITPKAGTIVQTTQVKPITVTPVATTKSTIVYPVATTSTTRATTIQPSALKNTGVVTKTNTFF